MIRPNSEPGSISEKAEAAFRDVPKLVVDRAKQTQTPVIVYVNNAIQTLTIEEFEEFRRVQSGGIGSDRKEDQ